ncbi:MAG: NCS2 family permease [Actinobacteria bacterium]|nr:NCS2 family permease [Actinomycetota bacterium]
MLDSYFKISQRGSTVGQEVRGGVVTFFTMAYIVALNPLIIGLAKDGEGKFLGGGDAPNLALVAAATALVAGVMSILMGAVANFPLALATGLGLNTFVAVGIASQMTWADAMGLVVLEGLIITVLVLTGFRVAVFKAVPTQLKVAISVGIGLFIALIGLVDAGFVRRTGSGPVPVTLGDGGTLVGWPIIVFAFGLILTIGLMVRKIKAAILIGIVVSTIAAIAIESSFKIGPNFDGATRTVNPKGWGLNVPAMPDSVVATPDFGLLGQFNLFGSFEKISLVSALLIIFSLLLADFFDTMGTMTAIGQESGLVDRDGNVPGAERILLVDSLAAAAGGAAGVSSNTSYIESAAGVGEGARTGLASIVTGICFLLTTFLAPLVAIIPYEAATPALIIVGFLMMTGIKQIDWDDLGIAIPAFLTIILMPFTYNISVGIGAGFVTYVVIRFIQGRKSEIHPLLFLVSGLFMVYFLASPINSWIG